jgi:sec-independent protein translocase protein TatA
MNGLVPMFAFFFGGAPSTPELLMVLLAVLLLFGAKRLPEIARGLGKSMEEFKKAARDVTDEIMHADVEPKAVVPKPLPPTEPVQSVAADAESDETPLDEDIADDAEA